MLGFQKAAWYYTEAGYGKSAADGIGGSIKQLCDRVVATGADILTAVDVFAVLETRSSTKGFLVTTTDIALNENIPGLSAAPSVFQTMQIHQVIWHKFDEDKLFFRYLTCTTCGFSIICEHHGMKKSTADYSVMKMALPPPPPVTIEKSFGKGDWVVVIFEKWYPGIIQSIENGVYEIKFMTRKGKKST